MIPRVHVSIYEFSSQHNCLRSIWPHTVSISTWEMSRPIPNHNLWCYSFFVMFHEQFLQYRRTHWSYCSLVQSHRVDDYLPLMYGWECTKPKKDSAVSGFFQHHYNDVIMGAIASQITSLTNVYSTVYSGADQRKHQSSAALAFVRGIHRGPVNSPHKWPVTRKMFPLMTSWLDLFISQ